MDTNDDMRETGEPEAPGAPVPSVKSRPSGKKSVLRQRLRRELDSFDFNALIQGVSTIQPAEETPAPQAAPPDRAAPLRAEDASAATLAEESSPATVTPDAPNTETSAWAVVKTPSNFPGFDLEPRPSADPRLVMASAYARAVASTPAASARQAAHNATPLPSIAHPNRKIVRSRPRRRRLNFPLVSLLTVLLMLAVGVAAALKWRTHSPMPAALKRSAHKIHKNGREHALLSSASRTTPSSLYSHRHRRRRRHHKRSL